MRIIIAGATGDIGQAIAKRLHSHQLLLLYRNEEKKKELAQRLPKAGFLNIYNLFQETDRIYKAFKQFTPNAFVNAIGDGFYAKVEDAFLELMEASYEANFKVPFILTQMIYRVMQSQRTGHIILINSVSGLEGFPYGIAYCPFKFALRGMAEVMFKEGKRYNIKVTSIYPGIVNTKLIAKMPFVPKQKETLTPETIAQAVEFILNLPPEAEVKDLIIKNTRLTWR